MRSSLAPNGYDEPAARHNRGPNASRPTQPSTRQSTGSSLTTPAAPRHRRAWLEQDLFARPPHDEHLAANGATGAPFYWPASTPFHVKHGWICDSTNVCRRSDFRLWVDGKRTSDFVLEEYTGSGATRTLYARYNVTNWNSGLAPGTYTFRWEFYLDGKLSTSQFGTGTRPVIICPPGNPPPDQFNQCS